MELSSKDHELVKITNKIVVGMAIIIAPAICTDLEANFKSLPGERVENTYNPYAIVGCEGAYNKSVP